MGDVSAFNALTPGFYRDIPDEVYHGLTPTVGSNSRCSELEKSEAHLIHSLTTSFETTEAMHFGKCYHLAILEPDKFDETVILTPQCCATTKSSGERCTKPAKVFEGPDGYCGTKGHAPEGVWMTADDIGLTLLPVNKYDTLREMQEVLMAHPTAPLILEGDIREGAMLWEDREIGGTWKGKIDHWSEMFDTLVDLKTAVDASPRGFAKAIYERGYYRQGPMYLDGLAEIGPGLTDFTLIAQEKKPPYNVGIYMLDEQSMELGRKHLASLMKRFREIVERRDLAKVITHGYGNDVEAISLPGYAVSALKERFN